MAEELSGVILLDNSEALERVDELRAALEGALTETATTFGDALGSALDSIDPIVVLEGDASAIGPEIEGAVDSADSVVPVDADASAIAPEVGDAIDAGASAPAVIEGDASGITDAIEDAVSDASPAVEGLGDTGAAAAGGVGSLGGALEGVGVASLAVQGNAAGAAQKIGTLGGASAGTVGGLAAAAAGIGALAKEAIEGAGAEKQFEVATGAMAASVRQVDVGTLNEDLADLALRVGSTDDQLFRATGTAFQFAEAFGFSSEESGTFAERIAALSARAVALRPDLGDVGDAAGRLTNALASGREKALLPFNLGLTQTQIKAHAADLGLAEVDGTVNKAALAFAGADLAAKKFGGTMDADIARGADNPIIQMRTLGATAREAIEELGRPLIVPALELMEEGVPLVTAFGGAMATLGETALPIARAGLQLALPPLEAVAAVLKVLSPLLGPALAGFIAFQAISFLPAVLTLVGTAFQFVGASALAAGADTLAASAAMSATPIGAIAAGLAVVATALGVFGSAARDVSGEVDFLTGATDRQVDALARQYAILAASLAGPDKAREESLRVLRDLADQNVVAAQKFGDALVDAGVLKQGEVNKVTDQAVQHQIELQENTEASKDLIEEQGDAFEVAAAKADTFIAALDRSVNVNLDALTAQVAYEEAVRSTGDLLAFTSSTLDINTEAGRNNRDAIADAASSAQAYADAIIRQTNDTAAGKAVMDEFTQRLLDSVPAGSAARTTLEELLVSLGLLPAAGTDAAQGFTDADVPGTVDRVLTASHDVFLSKMPQMRNTALTGGRSAGTALGKGAQATAPPEVARAIDLARSLGFGGAALTGLIRAADAAGEGVGGTFGHAVATGIRSSTPDVQDAARGIVRAARLAAANAGSPSEHLFYDVAALWPQAMATALSDGSSAVVAEAESIARAAAAVGLPVAPPSASAGGSGTLSNGGIDTIRIDEIRIVVDGVPDPTMARAAAKAGVDGALDALDGAARRRILNGAVTG